MTQTKSVFVIKMSEDGNGNDVFTNIKALYSGLMDTGYQCSKISFMDIDMKHKLIPFSYTSLVKAIRISQKKGRFAMCDILCMGGSEIEVQQMSIRSK